LPASSCSCCWRCAGVVGELPFKVRPVLRKHLPALCLHFACILLASMPASCCCPCHWHCAGIIAVLRGAFALVAPASLSSSPLPCLQHCDLASAQSRNTRNKCLRHCQHHAIIVAGNCRHCCPCHTGVFALVALVLPTLAYLRCASITNWHLPSHDAVVTCTGEALLLRSSLSVTLAGVWPTAIGPSAVWPRQQWCCGVAVGCLLDG
jgi:hypothetical protein